VRICKTLLKFPHKQKNFVCFLSKLRAANVFQERFSVPHSGVPEDSSTLECHTVSTWYINVNVSKHCSFFIFRVKLSIFGNFGNYLPVVSFWKLLYPSSGIKVPTQSEALDRANNNHSIYT
jgi:hypothetical protein